MAGEKCRRARSRKRLGVASYSGREGRTYYFNVAFEDGSTELLTVSVLRSRIASSDAKQAPGLRAVIASAKVSKPEPMPGKPGRSALFSS